jgi:hypothetical protein
MIAGLVLGVLVAAVPDQPVPLLQQSAPQREARLGRAKNTADRQFACSASRRSCSSSAAGVAAVSRRLPEASRMPVRFCRCAAVQPVFPRPAAASAPPAESRSARSSAHRCRPRPHPQAENGQASAHPCRTWTFPASPQRRAHPGPHPLIHRGPETHSEPPEDANASGLVPCTGLPLLPSFRYPYLPRVTTRGRAG